MQIDSQPTSITDTLQISAAIVTEVVRLELSYWRSLRLIQMAGEHLHGSGFDGYASADSSETDTPTQVRRQNHHII